MKRSLTAALLALTLAACGGDDDAGEERTNAPASGAFPVTVEHKYGKTTVESEPERVVTVGYTDQDAVLALGVVPVGVGDFLGGYEWRERPWAQDALKGAQPEVVSGQEINFEAVAAQRPDLIIAINAGLKQADYDKLSRLAPTVAQSGDYIDFGMPWDEQTMLVGQALGREDRAKQVVADVKASFEQFRTDHADAAGKTAIIGLRRPGRLRRLLLPGHAQPLPRGPRLQDPHRGRQARRRQLLRPVQPGAVPAHGPGPGRHVRRPEGHPRQPGLQAPGRRQGGPRDLPRPHRPVRGRARLRQRLEPAVSRRRGRGERWPPRSTATPRPRSPSRTRTRRPAERERRRAQRRDHRLGRRPGAALDGERERREHHAVPVDHRRRDAEHAAARLLAVERDAALADARELRAQPSGVGDRARAVARESRRAQRVDRVRANASSSLPAAVTCAGSRPPTREGTGGASRPASCSTQTVSVPSRIASETTSCVTAYRSPMNGNASSLSRARCGTSWPSSNSRSPGRTPPGTRSRPPHSTSRDDHAMDRRQRELRAPRELADRQRLHVERVEHREHVPLRRTHRWRAWQFARHARGHAHPLALALRPHHRLQRRRPRRRLGPRRRDDRASTATARSSATTPRRRRARSCARSVPPWRPRAPASPTSCARASTSPTQTTGRRSAVSTARSSPTVRPAASMLVLGLLDPRMRVEIEAIAYAPAEISCAARR